MGRKLDGAPCCAVRANEAIDGGRFVSDSSQDGAIDDGVVSECNQPRIRRSFGRGPTLKHGPFPSFLSPHHP